MQLDTEPFPKLKILIADDHALFRGGLTSLVEMIDQKVETSEASSIEEISNLLRDTPEFDLILLDLMMPGVEGLNGLEQLRENWPEIPVIVVSAKEDCVTIREALAKGAMGFIPKSSAANVTFGAIKLVLSGGIYLPPTLLTQPDPVAYSEADSQNPGPQFSNYGLTLRQVEVLKLVSLGKSNNEIADQLSLTLGTVKMHVSRAFKVLEVNNRTEAAAKFGEIEKQVS